MNNIENFIISCESLMINEGEIVMEGLGENIKKYVGKIFSIVKPKRRHNTKKQTMNIITPLEIVEHITKNWDTITKEIKNGNRILITKETPMIIDGVQYVKETQLWEDEIPATILMITNDIKKRSYLLLTIFESWDIKPFSVGKIIFSGVLSYKQVGKTYEIYTNNIYDNLDDSTKLLTGSKSEKMMEFSVADKK